jgi:hypothetical protein
MCILTILSLFCTASTNTSSKQMLTGSEFILFRVVVETLGYFIFSLVLFYTCLYTFLSRTTRTWEGVMQGLDYYREPEFTWKGNIWVTKTVLWF